MCLLRAWHALKENDKYCSTGSLKKVMLQASNKWSLKYLKVLQSFNNPNAKARWLTSTENKSCSQTVRSGLRQSNFSGIFFFWLMKNTDYFFFFTYFEQESVFLGLFASIRPGVPCTVHVPWCSAAALFFQHIRFCSQSKLPIWRPSKSFVNPLLFVIFFCYSLKHSFFSNSFVFLCQIQLHSQQAWSML